MKTESEKVVEELNSIMKSTDDFNALKHMALALYFCHQSDFAEDIKNMITEFSDSSANLLEIRLHSLVDELNKEHKENNENS